MLQSLVKEVSFEPDCLTRLGDSLFEKNPKVCELPLFSSNSLEDLVRKSKITGTLTETENMYSVAHRCLSDPFVPTHRRRRKGAVSSRLSMLVRSQWSQQRSNVGVKSLHDNI